MDPAIHHPASAGYVPRLLSAAAFLTRRASDESLAGLRLTQERATVLGLLVTAPAGEAALADASELAAECVRECLLALQCCGYATADGSGSWTATAAGAAIQAQAAEAEARLLAHGNDDDEALRQELHALIAALTPPPGGSHRSQAI